MAKAIQFYTGNDTNGHSVEVALRFDGVWFVRHQTETQWGLQYVKWAKLEGQPEFVTHYTNVYTGEVGKFDEPRISWGFQELKKLDYLKSRLPNH